MSHHSMRLSFTERHHAANAVNQHSGGCGIGQLPRLLQEQWRRLHGLRVQPPHLDGKRVDRRVDTTIVSSRHNISSAYMGI